MSSVTSLRRRPALVPITSLITPAPMSTLRRSFRPVPPSPINSLARRPPRTPVRRRALALTVWPRGGANLGRMVTVRVPSDGNSILKTRSSMVLRFRTKSLCQPAWARQWVGVTMPPLQPVEAILQAVEAMGRPVRVMLRLSLRMLRPVGMMKRVESPLATPAGSGRERSGLR